jgi:hypothetical protein
MKTMQIDTKSILSKKLEKSSISFISTALKNRMLNLSVAYLVDYWQNVSLESFEFDIDEYLKVLANAEALRLFSLGGIDRKDHLNLYFIQKMLNFDTYIESGVFTGSSLHAALKNTSINKVIGIDPEPWHLKPELAVMMKTKNYEFISDKDFSELGNATGHSLVYFDDHINTASRILQASALGYKYVIFDDSTGLEGITQRLYPAVPTVFMIMHEELFNPGDELCWSTKLVKSNLRSFLSYVIKRRMKDYRVQMKITKDMKLQMQEAKKLVSSVHKLPDLSEYFYSSQVGRLNNTQKYLLELR